MTDSAATPDKKPAPAKAKPPKPEDKPFSEFVPQLLLPALEKEIQSYGGPAPQLQLEQGPMPVVGETCWQIRGELPGEAHAHRFTFRLAPSWLKSNSDCALSAYSVGR